MCHNSKILSSIVFLIGDFTLRLHRKKKILGESCIFVAQGMREKINIALTSS